MNDGVSAQPVYWLKEFAAGPEKPGKLFQTLSNLRPKTERVVHSLRRADEPRGEDAA
jgi:hypothetical protein